MTWGTRKIGARGQFKVDSEFNEGDTLIWSAARPLHGAEVAYERLKQRETVSPVAGSGDSLKNVTILQPGDRGIPAPRVSKGGGNRRQRWYRKGGGPRPHRLPSANNGRHHAMNLLRQSQAKSGI